MSRYRLGLDLPDLDVLLAGLTLADDPALRAARRRVDDAEQRLAQVRAAVAARTREADEAAAAHATGRGTATEVERAVTARTAAGLALAPAEREHHEAQAAILPTTEAAKRRLFAEGERRLALLQAVASRVSPVLEQLVDLEGELTERIHRQTGRGLPDLEWPSPLSVQVTLNRARPALTRPR